VKDRKEDIERRVLAVLQNGLPRSRTPYSDMAREVGISTDELLSILRDWQQDGTIRRMGAIVNHFQVALGEGAMVAWKVEPQRVAEVGEILAGFDEVSHAYERVTAPNWPYNVYTMVHGTTAEAVRRSVERMSEAAAVSEYLVLSTVRELKKTPPKYIPAGTAASPREDAASALPATSDERRATPHTRVLRMLFWETTVRCNLACAHCRRLESNEAGVADLSTAEAEALIGQLGELGRRQGAMPVVVFSGGEPLCRGDLFDLVAAARQQGLICALATNGTMVNDAVARRIRDSGIDRVSVSLDGATAEVHDRMRQIPGAFDGAIAGIRRLGEQGVPFQINFTLTRQNAAQLADVHELAGSLGAVAVHIFILVPVGCGLTLAQTDMLSPQQYEQIMRDIYRLESDGPIQIKVTCGPHYQRVKREMRRETGDGPSQPSHADATPPAQAVPPSAGRTAHSAMRGCLAGLGVLFVSHRGDVYPCGYLPVNCGNVLRQRLVDIWDKNEDLARMRDAAALEGKCGLCEYRRVCGGCRARAFAATGNYMAEEPFCAYVPRGAEV